MKEQGKSPSKLLMNANTLRRTLRTVHCLQRERGPSCAPSENHDFLIKSRLDTDHAISDCHDLRLGDAPIRLVLERIRGMIDENRISRHRTLSCFTTLISAVLHEHILSFTSKAIAAAAQDETPVPKTSHMNRIKSHQNFTSIGSDDMGSRQRIGRRPRSQSIGPVSDFAMEMALENVQYAPIDSFQRVKEIMHDNAAAQAPIESYERLVDLNDHAPGVPIHAASHDDVSLSRLSSLSQLLSVFVCIKESTGKERASLYSMLASDHDDAVVVDADFLLGDVVMEIENQRRQLEQLQHIRNHPLQNLVQELVIMSKDMQQVQDLLSSGCLLESIKEYYSATQLWDLLTVYMDKLHSLELLIVEEMELALPIPIASASCQDVALEATILSEAFGFASSAELENAIENMSPDEVKTRLLRALKVQTQSIAIVEEKREDEVASKGMDELMNDLYGNIPAMKEWEIGVYELKFLKRIGQGAAGTTYLADWSGENVAVKVASITEFGLDGWRTEVQALQKLHHPNIIRLLGSVYHQHPLTFCLVLEYCDAGDLASAMEKTVPPNFFFHVATSITKGLVYLHHRGVIHRDIKPHNILLHGDLASGHYQVKVTDFGVAADLHNLDDRSPETGTYRFMSPEVIRHEPYTETSDVYSFGIIMWQLLTREEPFANLGQIEAAAVVAMEFARPIFPTDTPPLVKNLIERCWVEDPANRPSFSEILLELNSLKFDLSEEEQKWLDAPLGHSVYKPRMKQSNQELAAPPAANVDLNLDIKKKKKFGLFARKSSHF
ncbi:hypothetical protein MPSEU_000164600 [Mayamaea pseudoterrestris]|nr:hypothetical protein MPSEU_000164600 [Mayamaea pseudoterrestris]